MEQNKIPTAAEKLMDLKTYFKRGKTSDNKEALNGFALWEDIPRVMIQFAKLHVQAALKEAAENATFDTKIHSEYQGSLGNEEGLLFKDTEVVNINKDSILNSYSLENIK